MTSFSPKTVLVFTMSKTTRPILALGCVALRQYIIRRLAIQISGFVDSNWMSTFDEITGLPVFRCPSMLPLPMDHYDFISFGGEKIAEEYSSEFPGLSIIAHYPSRLYLPRNQGFMESSIKRVEARLSKSFSRKQLVSAHGGPSLNSDDRHAPVCLVVHRLTFGGAEKQICLLAKGLKALGFNVRILCFYTHHPGYSSIVSDLHALGISVQVFNARQSLDTERSRIIETGVTKDFIGLFPGAFQEFIVDSLFRYFSLERPLAVISYLESSNLLSAIAGVCARVPKVLMSGRNVSLNELEDPSEFCGEVALQRELYRVILKFPNTKLFTNSPEGARSYFQWLGLRSLPKVVGNAFDAVFRESPRCLNKISAGRTLVVGMMARLAKEKSPLRFVDLIAHLRSLQIYETRGIYQGDGPLRDQFEDTVSKRGLSSFVELRLASRETKSFWDSIDILVLTSSSEGTPNVIMECMLRRVPFVTTYLGSLSEIRSPWLQSMVSSSCLTEMSEKILFLMKHVSEIDWGPFDDFARSHDSRWLAIKTLDV